jgi:hypothetical protein
MKTGKTLRHDLSPLRRKTGMSGDDELAVLVDTWTHAEYYMHVIDAFPAYGQEYAVMVPYELDDGTRREMEVVLLRTMRGANAETLYMQIHSRKERKAVFEVFLSRLETAGGL